MPSKKINKLATHRRHTIPIAEKEADDLVITILRDYESPEEPEYSGPKKSVALLFHSKIFHIVVVALCCLDGLLVVCMLLMEIEVLKLKPGKLRSQLVTAQFSFECISVSIVSLFLLEIMMKLWLFGCKFYLKHWLEIVDAVVCIVSFAVDIYNIVRHTQHTLGHDAVIMGDAHAPTNNMFNDTTSKPSTYSEDTSYVTVQNTLADAAGLLVLFRLWRVIRIVNAIIISVATSQEGSMKKLKDQLVQAEERIRQLEEILSRNGISVVPTKSKEKPI